jgi:choline dehydrogenase-like flavoprotein
MAARFGQHAIVIGGSMTGLMTARVLADHFDTVTVLERDHIDEHPAIHKSIPQGNHYHAVLLGGQQVLSTLYPDFIDKLRSFGSVRLRLGEEWVWYLPDGKAYSASATPVRSVRCAHETKRTNPWQLSGVPLYLEPPTSLRSTPINAGRY